MILFKSGHPDYIGQWHAHHLTRSFKKGARWNSARTPVLYFSSNSQNAMLELANYAASPQIANAVNVMAVFGISDELSLYPVTPGELPDGWNDPHGPFIMQQFGDSILNDSAFDGLIVPTVTIADDLVRHPSNAVRDTAYANIVLNPTRPRVSDTLSLISIHKPIYNAKMFHP